MRQVAVFHEKIKECQSGIIRIDPSQVQTFKLNQISVTAGVLETLDTQFNRALPENHHKVLVRKKAFSCNYRDKGLLLQAKQRIDSFADQNEIKFYSLGSEFVGEIVATGLKVETLEIGDRVIGNGNYPFSDYENAMPGLPTNHGSKELEVFHFSKLVRIPAEMSDEVAAGFSIGGQTAYSMIRRLNLKTGENVLVTAATSNTSLFAIHALKNYPVNVYAITTRSDFVTQLYGLGVKKVFVVKRGMRSLAQDRHIKNFVYQNRMFDAVIDPFFDVYLGQVIDVMAIEARYITCGMYAQPYVAQESNVKTLPTDLRHIMGMAMIKNIQILGNCIGNTRDLEHSIQDYADGKLGVIIDSVFQYNEVSEFFERSFNSSDRFGKVVCKY